jgi:cell division protein FtsZ
MSMAEIQEAAEIITSAVSPNANIIFGATLKPEMEDELVITVIATGFDSDTFHQQDVSLTVGETTSQAEEEGDEEMVKNIDLELDKEEAAEKFAAEPETNMWDAPATEVEDEEDDTPAFLRRRKKNKE